MEAKPDEYMNQSHAEKSSKKKSPTLGFPQTFFHGPIWR